MDHDHEVTTPGLKDGLIYSYLFDGTALSLEETLAWTPERGLLWMHMDYTDEGVQEWLLNESGLDPIIAEALVDSDIRPRELAVPQGILLALRGVNVNPGADPEDMVSIRMWVEPYRILTLRRLRVKAIEDVKSSLLEQGVPQDPKEFLRMVAVSITERIANVVGDIIDRVDAIEEAVIEDNALTNHEDILPLRRQIVMLRRYVSPQREVLMKLSTERGRLFDDDDRQYLREQAERTIRLVEDLDSARDRASITQEELAGRMQSRMNRTMYMLSIVAALFIPLSFVTGLLGINVGGIPGTDSPWAFALVCVMLCFIGAFQILLYKAKRWL